LFAIAFEKATGIDRRSKLGEVPEEKIEILEKIILNPVSYGIPAWSVNRPNDFELGTPRHLVMNDLDFALRTDFLRLGEIKSYRGLRHQWGLTVRGQRTKSTHRGKGGVVGVTKKDVAAKSAPKAAAAPAKDAGKGAKK
jgi:small subunit ribosomal protein S13